MFTLKNIVKNLKYDFCSRIYDPKQKQAGAELGQAQVRLDDMVEVVIDVVVKAVVKVEV